MKRLRAFLRRLAGFFHRNRWERDIDAELASNMELNIDENLRAGMNPGEARHAALRRFGGVAAAKDAYRDRRLIPSLESLAQDVRYAGRMLRRSPASSAAVVLLLGLGLGVNTTIFSLMNGLFLRPLPAVDDGGSLVNFGRNWNHQNYQRVFSYATYLEMRDSARSFSNLAAFFHMSQFGLTADGWTERVMGEYVSGNYFETFGVGAALGRVTLDPGERAVVISYRSWQSRFGADPSVVGKNVLVNGAPVVIAGVAEQGFRGVYLVTALDLFVPLHLGREEMLAPENAWLRIVGRLKPGVDRGQAQAELAVFSESWNVDRPEDERMAILAEAYNSWPSSPGSRGRAMGFFSILAAVTVVAVVVICANVTNLMLARAAARGRETAVRVALGAGRARIVRQALIEGFALSAAGAALSLVIAISSVEPLSRFFPDEAEAPMTLDLAPDWRVLGYVILLAFVSTLAFAIPPALKASRWDVWRSLRANEAAVAGGGSRLRAALTVAQVALCFVLLAGSGLLMRSLYLLESVDTGLTAGQVTLATLDAELSRSDGRAKGIDELDPDARRLYEDEMRRLYEGIAQRAAAIPGVDGAALAATVPLLGWSYSLGKLHGGEVAEEGAFAATGNIVTPDYFKTMEIPILQGRLFSPADGVRTSRVAIVSETLARRLWPAGDAVGQVLYVGGSAEENGRHVIGVARDVPHDLQENQNELYYVPHQQQTASRMILHVRSSMDLAVLLPAMRSAVAEVDPRLPLFNVRTLQAVKLESYWQQRMAAVIVGFSAVLAVLLAAIGLYAVMASRVTQRSREIGIRMALGASADRIRRGVIWESSRLCLIGVAVGGALAFAGTQALASLLYGVTPTDLLTFATVFAILTLVTVAASYLPARRATSVNPVNALRSE